MKKINIIEIDYDGQMSSVQTYEFESLPRINERVIIPESNGGQRICKVLDVHHSLHDHTTLYIMSDYRSIKNVVQRLVSQME